MSERILSSGWVAPLRAAVASALALAALVTAPVPAAAKPVNAICLVSGEEVDREVTSKVTVVIGYCCDDCAGDAGEPEYRKAMGKAIAAAAAEPVNRTCPVTGKLADPKKALQHGDRLVAFADSAARSEFKREPEKFDDKVVTDRPGNEECPLSGDEISPSSVYPVTIEYGFCSGRCLRKFGRDREKILARAAEKS